MSTDLHRSNYTPSHRTSLARLAAFLTCAACIVLASACTQSDVLQQIASPESQARATTYIDLLRNRSFDELERAADPTIAGPTMHDTLVQMADQIPDAPPTSTTLIGAQIYENANGKTTNLTFQYGFPDKWLAINVALLDRPRAPATLVGLNVYTLTSSLEELNRFRLDGKSWIQYLALAAAVVFPLLTAYALIACIRTKIAERKWAWIIFIVVGFGEAAVNWTTGQWTLSLGSVQLFSAGIAAQLYGPWIVSVSLPVGAVVFLLRRRRLAVADAR